MKAALEKRLAILRLKLPVDFGVHIRMTDKLYAEAKLHSWREYFHHVDHRMRPGLYYHSFHDLKQANTTAFVATDEPKIFAEKGRMSISQWRHNRIVWNEEGQ